MHMFGRDKSYLGVWFFWGGDTKFIGKIYVK